MYANWFFVFVITTTDSTDCSHGQGKEEYPIWKGEDGRRFKTESVEGCQSHKFCLDRTITIDGHQFSLTFEFDRIIDLHQRVRCPIYVVASAAVDEDHVDSTTL